MDERKIARKGAEKAKEFAGHVERLATNVLSGGAVEHLQNAGKEFISAIDATMKDMSIPDDTKKHILKAEKETVLAAKGFLDSVLKEIEKVETDVAKKPKDKLKKINVK